MFRFSIRELLLVTLVVAMGLGWLSHWQAMERRHAKRGEYIEKLKDALRIEIGLANTFNIYKGYEGGLRNHVRRGRAAHPP